MISSPQHSASVDSERIPWATTTTVRSLIGMMLAFSAALAVVHLATGAYEELRLTLLLALTAGGGLLLLRRDPEWAVFLVTSVGTATLWWPIANGFGLHDIIVIAYVFLAVLAALGLGRVRFLVVLTMIIVSIAGITWLEVGGWVEMPIPGEIGDGISIVALVLITSLFARRVARDHRLRRRELVERGREQAAEHALIGGIVAASPVGIVHLGAGGRVELANERALEILSAERSGEGQHARDLFADLQPVAEGHRSEELMAAIAEGRELVDLRFAIETDGIPRWVSLNCRPIAADVGGGAVVTVEDRTAWQTALEEVEGQRAHFSALVETLSEVVSVVDEEGRIRYVSPVLGRVLGHSSENRYGRDALELVHPEDYEHSLAALAQVQAEPESQASVRIRMRTADEEWKWIDVRLRNPAAEAQVGGVVVTLRDVSPEEQVKRALEKSEERFQRIFRHNPVPMSLSRLEDGRILDLNDSFIEIFGYEYDAVVGRRAETTEVWARPEQRAAVVSKLLEADSVRGAEVVLVTSAGEHRPFLLSADRLDVDGQDCVILAGTDLTEYKALEGRLLQTQKLQLVAQMTSGIAHDFKNWLTPIRGYCDLLEESLPENVPERQYVARIAASADRAHRLVRQLLGFTRERTAESSEVDLNQLLRGLSDLEPLLSSHVELQMDLDSRIAPVKVQAADLEQVVMNLLLNAAEASSDQGQIRLRTSMREIGESWQQALDAQRVSAELRPGRYVELSICDDGSGMTEAETEQLFEPFFTTKHRAEGSGLGLFTANASVKNYDGAIVVQTAPGRGSTFTVLLPALPSPS